MPLPNFFIIGAPKAGTTALYDTLAGHPDIYMTPVKEPCFFATQGQPPLSPGPAGAYLHQQSIWKARDYVALFDAVSTERAIGEASPIYLRSPLAAERIRRNVPDAKIIAILRNPAERAHSHFWHMVQRGLETVDSFEEALEQEPQRRALNWFSAFYYQANGFYYQQLRAYFDLFPREQIKVYLYEDWKNEPQTFLCDVLRFLEVSTQFIPPVQKTNVTRLPRSRRFHQLAERVRAHQTQSAQNPIALPKRLLASGLNRLDGSYNSILTPTLEPETRRRLLQEYRANILQLQELLGRELSAWIN